MQITIKLFATFRNNRFKEAHQEHATGTDIRSITNSLGLTPGDIGVLMVNGRHAEIDDVLNDGDTLSIFPLVGGG